MFFMGMTKEGFFFGGHVGHFLGPGNGFPKMRVFFSKNEGGFYALKCFSNVILRDKLAVKHKDKLKTFT